MHNDKFPAFRHYRDSDYFEFIGEYTADELTIAFAGENYGDEVGHLVEIWIPEACTVYTYDVYSEGADLEHFCAIWYAQCEMSDELRQWTEMQEQYFKFVGRAPREIERPYRYE